MLSKSHIAVLVAGAFFAAQTGAARVDESYFDESYADSEQITVFNEDGTSYTISPVDIEVAVLEPSSTEVIVAPAAPVVVAMAEPVVVVARVDDISVDPISKRDFSTIEENHRLNVDHH